MCVRASLCVCASVCVCVCVVCVAGGDGGRTGFCVCVCLLLFSLFIRLCRRANALVLPDTTIKSESCGLPGVKTTAVPRNLHPSKRGRPVFLFCFGVCV